jgi:glycosyltransferase involved in cell wall biosynthesis
MTREEPALALSVIVCTRNRAQSLRTTLDSLVRQDPPGGDWEIVVVDNGSTDETPEVVGAFAPHGVRYTVESEPGLGRARNAGIAIARGSLLAFTDDDIIVHSDWAARIRSRFAQASDISAVFGFTYGDAGVQQMFSLRTRPYACYIEGKERVWESSPGNNMAYRRAVLERIGLFDPSLGPGAKYHMADDAELHYRLFKAGLRAFYDPEIKVIHRPDVAGRPIESELLRCDAGTAAWYGKHTARGDWFTARLFLIHVGRSSMGVRTLIRALRRGDLAELRLRARRLRVLLHAFFSRAAMEFRQ